MSCTSLSEHLTLTHSFKCIASYPALIAFSVATVLESAAYNFPWLVHLLDTIASPAAIVAGTVVTASMISGMSPFLQWTLAAIAGGGAAGLVQGATVLTRAASTATTGGLGNPLVATGELALSVVTTILSFVVPVLVIAALIGAAVFASRKLWLRYRTVGNA